MTDWSTYKIVVASDSCAAIHKSYKDKNFRLIGYEELDDQTVTHAMCCEYSDYMKIKFQSCTDDMDRILLMNILPQTQHYQLTRYFEA